MIYDCLTLSIKQDTAKEADWYCFNSSFNKPYAAVLHDTIRCDEQFVKLLMKKVLLLKIKKY